MWPSGNRPLSRWAQGYSFAALMFCGGTGFVSTQTNWISRLICDARRAPAGRGHPRRAGQGRAQFWPDSGLKWQEEKLWVIFVIDRFLMRWIWIHLSDMIAMILNWGGGVRQWIRWKHRKSDRRGNHTQGGHVVVAPSSRPPPPVLRPLQWSLQLQDHVWASVDLFLFRSVVHGFKYQTQCIIHERKEACEAQILCWKRGRFFL